MNNGWGCVLEYKYTSCVLEYKYTSCVLEYKYTSCVLEYKYTSCVLEYKYKHHTHLQTKVSLHTHIQTKESSHTHTSKNVITHIQTKRSSHTQTKESINPSKIHPKKWHIYKNLTLQRFSSHLCWLVLASLELSFVHCSKITWSTPSTQRLSLWFLLWNCHHVLFGRLTQRKGVRCFGGMQLLGFNSFLVLTFIPPPPHCAQTHSTRILVKQRTDTDSLTW